MRHFVMSIKKTLEFFLTYKKIFATKVALAHKLEHKSIYSAKWGRRGNTQGKTPLAPEFTFFEQYTCEPSTQTEENGDIG